METMKIWKKVWLHKQIILRKKQCAKMFFQDLLTNEQNVQLYKRTYELLRFMSNYICYQKQMKDIPFVEYGLYESRLGREKRTVIWMNNN